MKKKVIIFGATGAVGAYTALHLISEGYEVIAVGKRSSDNDFFKDFNTSYISVDITNNSDFDKLPKSDIFAVVHLSGFLPANMQGYDPQKFIDVNITGTMNILKYAAQIGVLRYIYTTSFSDVSYLWGSETLIDPDSVVRFPLNNDHSIYSISKNTGASLVQHFAVRHNFKNYILRFPNIYLYHPNMKYYVDGVIRRKGLFNIIDQAIKGENIELWGSPSRRRDMVYVKDCVQIIEKCLSAESNGGTYNVGTGIGTTRKDQINEIIQVFSPKDKLSKIIYRNDLADSPQYIMDINKTKKELGYEPEFGYIESLEDLKQEMESNRFKKLWGTPQSYNEL